MTVKENGLKIILSGVLAGATAYFNVLIVPLAVLLFVMICDYATGMTSAYVNGKISSRAGIIGIIKKVCYMFAVVVGICLDYIIVSALSKINLEVGTVYYFGMLVTVWLILNELISIHENLDEIGVPLPAFLKKIVNRLIKNTESAAETEGKGESESKGKDKGKDKSVVSSDCETANLQKKE